MQRWLKKVISVLSNPVYPNTKQAYVDIPYADIYNSNRYVNACCALGELYLQAGGDPMYAYSRLIHETLKDVYKVPAKIEQDLFEYINRHNVGGASKQRIATLLKRKFGAKKK